MREILFRGKGTCDCGVNAGEWIYGYYVNDFWKRNDCGIIPSDYEKGGYCEVLPETVGQYTGLTDKNGKKIFEGDIVTVYARGFHTVCTVSWAGIVAQFQLWQINTIPKTPTVLNLGNYECEVIGNIHDNPELLKGNDKS